MGIVINEGKLYFVCDIVFCIDASFSMIPIVDYIKEVIYKLAKEVLDNNCKKIDWRAQTIVFRDNVAYSRPFVATIEELKAQLDEVKAKGFVENKPAPVFETIRCAVQTPYWRNAHKFIILFTDTTPKPITDSDFVNFAEELSDQHIKLYLWGKKDSLYEKMLSIPRSNIIQIDDPMKFYYHQEISLENLIECLTPMDLEDYYDDCL